MKKVSIILLLVLLFGVMNLKAQNEELQDIPSGVENTWEGQIGGYVLPSEGTINVLFCFCTIP